MGENSMAAAPVIIDICVKDITEVLIVWVSFCLNLRLHELTKTKDEGKPSVGDRSHMNMIASRVPRGVSSFEVFEQDNTDGILSQIRLPSIPYLSSRKQFQADRTVRQVDRKKPGTGTTNNKSQQQKPMKQHVVDNRSRAYTAHQPEHHHHHDVAKNTTPPPMEEDDMVNETPIVSARDIASLGAAEEHHHDFPRPEPETDYMDCDHLSSQPQLDDPQEEEYRKAHRQYRDEEQPREKEQPSEKEQYHHTKDVPQESRRAKEEPSRREKETPRHQDTRDRQERQERRPSRK